MKSILTKEQDLELQIEILKLKNDNLKQINAELLEALKGYHDSATNHTYKQFNNNCSGCQLIAKAEVK